MTITTTATAIAPETAPATATATAAAAATATAATTAAAAATAAAHYSGATPAAGSMDWLVVALGSGTTADQAVKLEALEKKGQLEMMYKVDFLNQEMVRETTTMTAKGNDAKISSSAVNIKAEAQITV